ncbi:MAG: hypothetical protein ACR2IV_05965 [Bryobacteraceae bacterium]
MLALLVGCGLRRGELLALTMRSIQMREEHWVVADLLGRAGHIRTIRIPVWVKDALNEWIAGSGIIEGRIFRPIKPVKRLMDAGRSRNAQALKAHPKPVFRNASFPEPR